MRPFINPQAQLHQRRLVGAEVVGDIEGDGGPLAGQRSLEVDRHLAVDPIYAEGAAPGPLSLYKTMSGRVDLVLGGQRLRRTDCRQQQPLRIAIGVPVEDIDPRSPGAMVAAGDCRCTQAVFFIRLFRTDERIGEIAVETGIDGDFGSLAQIGEAGDIDAGVGHGVAGWNEDIDEPLIDPRGDVVADPAAHLE